MGCFGKCGCEECCLSDSELLDIATSVTIEHTIYNQTATFVGADCCHVAEIGDPDDYETIVHCFVTNDIQISESIVVRARFIRSQQYIPDPPIETCFLNEFFIGPDYSEVCGDVGSCASTTKNYSSIEKIAGFVRWKYGRTRVSIIKRLMQCPGFELPQCKYVVECSIETLVQLGALRKKAITKTSSNGIGDGCCHASSGWLITPGDLQDLPPGEDCSWNQTQSEPTFDCVADQDNADWGGFVTYWLRRFKVYDNAEDIPAVITMYDSDQSECIYEPCQEGFDQVCVLIVGDNIEPEQGGNLVTVVSQTTCAYCVKLEPKCDDVECIEFSQNYCSCDPTSGNRHNNGQGSATGFDSFAYVNNPYAVTNAVCFYPRLIDATAGTSFNDCETCEEHPLGYPGRGVPIDERTDCNWFECFNCLTGDDPWLSRIQPMQTTVDAYSFSSTAQEYTDTYCIPFPTVQLTLNP